MFHSLYHLALGFVGILTMACVTMMFMTNTIIPILAITIGVLYVSNYLSKQYFHENLWQLVRGINAPEDAQEVIQ